MRTHTHTQLQTPQTDTSSVYSTFWGPHIPSRSVSTDWRVVAVCTVTTNWRHMDACTHPMCTHSDDKMYVTNRPSRAYRQGQHNIRLSYVSESVCTAPEPYTAACKCTGGISVLCTRPKILITKDQGDFNRQHKHFFGI